MPSAVSLPTRSSLLPLLPLFLQSLLLTSRPFTHPTRAVLRAALGLWGAYLGLRLPVDHAFEPRDKAGAANFVWAVCGWYAAVKALEWGFCREEEVRWRGLPGERGEERERPLGNWAWRAWALLSSLRGIPWTWGTPPPLLPPALPSSLGQYTLASLRTYALHQTLFTLAAALICAAHAHGDSVDAFLGVGDSWGRYIRTAALGLAAWSGMSLGFTVLALLVRLLTPLFGGSFNAHAWRPLFLAPFRTTSITDLWNVHWHSLFRRAFIVSGFRPARALARAVGAGTGVQRVVGLLGAFAASGLMHEFGIRVSSPTHFHPSTLPSLQFFLLQGLGILLEQAFTRTTHKSVRGWPGRVWALAFVLLTGAQMADHWLDSGLAQGTVHPARWGWKRWVAPGGALWPEGVAMRGEGDGGKGE